MNQDMWSKSLLASYNYLPLVAKCIDRTNMQMALGSFSYEGDAMDIMEKMMANNARKEALVNAKVIVDTTLEMLKAKSREVLKLRYIKRKNFEQIAEIMNICLRSVFRWHEIAIKQFSGICKLRGYDENWMDKYYAGDSLFARCAMRCQQQDEERVSKCKTDTLRDKNTADSQKVKTNMIAAFDIMNKTPQGSRQAAQ